MYNTYNLQLFVSESSVRKEASNRKMRKEYEPALTRKKL